MSEPQQVHISELTREQREAKYGWVDKERNGWFLWRVTRIMIEQGIGRSRAFKQVEQEQRNGGGES